MFHNTPRLQATGEILHYWSHPIFCNVMKIQQDCQKRGKIFKLLKPPNLLKCLKIPQAGRQRGKFTLLKPPNILPCLKIQQDRQQREKFFKFLKPPNLFAMLQRKIQIIASTIYFAMFHNTTRLHARVENLNYLSHPIFCDICKYNKIARTGGGILSHWSLQILRTVCKKQHDHQQREKI